MANLFKLTFVVSTEMSTIDVLKCFLLKLNNLDYRMVSVKQINIEEIDEQLDEKGKPLKK